MHGPTRQIIMHAEVDSPLCAFQALDCAHWLSLLPPSQQKPQPGAMSPPPPEIPKYMIPGRPETYLLVERYNAKVRANKDLWISSRAAAAAIAAEPAPWSLGSQDL